MTKWQINCQIVKFLQVKVLKYKTMDNRTPKNCQSDIEVGERVKQLIEKSGKPSKEVATAIHWTESTISRKLDGSRKLSVGELIELLKILGIATSVEDLFNLLDSIAIMNAIGLKINPKSLIFFLTSRR